LLEGQFDSWTPTKRWGNDWLILRNGSQLLPCVVITLEPLPPPPPSPPRLLKDSISEWDSYRNHQCECGETATVRGHCVSCGRIHRRDDFGRWSHSPRRIMNVDMTRRQPRDRAPRNKSWCSQCCRGAQSAAALIGKCASQCVLKPARRVVGMCTSVPIGFTRRRAKHSAHATTSRPVVEYGIKSSTYGIGRRSPGQVQDLQNEGAGTLGIFC
jgi:hypothetical protein